MYQSASPSFARLLRRFRYFSPWRSLLSSGRLFAPHFRYTVFRCVLTVLRPRPTRHAISGPVRPSAASRAISYCLTDRPNGISEARVPLHHPPSFRRHPLTVGRVACKQGTWLAEAALNASAFRSASCYTHTHTHTHTHTAHRPSTALASRRSAAFRVSTPSKNMALPLLGVRPFALRAVCRKPHPSPLQHEEATYDA